MEVLPSPKSTGWGAAAPGCTSWHQVPGRNSTHPPATALPHHHSLQLPSACTAAVPAAILWDVLTQGEEPGWGELLANNSSERSSGPGGPSSLLHKSDHRHRFRSLALLCPHENNVVWPGPQIAEGKTYAAA